jgi:hypothetical protein
MPPVYRQFLDSSGELQIDVDDTGGGASTGGGYASALADALLAVASRTEDQLSTVSQEQRPAELVLAFDLIALDGGGFAISRGGEAANFHVWMRWSSDQGDDDTAGSLPKLPGLGPGQL